ncbi:MAG: isoleucine--tRNA ligase [Candidatus Buchananbacteria bacterium]|nr:isoleucine--tRNA ligase [Candidatus Buchananbacteria bacterium]
MKSNNPTQSKKHPLVLAEEETQKQWQAKQIFEKSVAKDAPKGDYVFYDGPPFATGMPHYGHLLPGIMKDVMPRYQTMRGYRVERRWGWDCHGLPIENIVEKELGFKHKKEIEEFGVAKFNELCRSKVLGYVEEWKTAMGRFGRWADMDNAYTTMSREYMESVWWVFKSLWDKDLIYEGYKSMHICPRCETTLSQQEVSEGYKTIKDWSVTVKLELVDEPGTFLLAWTTTPWTLPANVALAVSKTAEYSLWEVKKMTLDNYEIIDEKIEKYILSTDAALKLFGLDDLKPITRGGPGPNDEQIAYNILERFNGSEIIGQSYKPLFDYYPDLKDIWNKDITDIGTGRKVYGAEFVTNNEGTGIVHIAPAFGENDYQLGLKEGLPFVQNVGMDGKYDQTVTDFAGMSVKPIDDHMATDVEIIKYLAKRNLLFAKEKIEHSYPHCWRCDTPLLNYATSSWFVAVTKIKNDLLSNAKQINWFPEHIKEGRFGKWLEGARDWSISRQRFWASVMPVWKCSCGETKVFGSVAELEAASNQQINDLHKHIVDEITIQCEKCGETMHRIPDVLDTWFDSGSMPYAQLQYPFTNEDKLAERFPADFIAEGQDQTRAWFYYLHVLAGALKGSVAFKQVIVNGIVLAEDGKKMSKKLQNYPPLDTVLDQYGADALRYYLVTSPGVAAENLSFSEKGVKEVFQKVVMLTSNVVSFYEMYKTETVGLTPSEHILDRWIIAKLNVLISDVETSMASYDLARASRPIQEFIDELSTWWLRRSRDRFKGADKMPALTTLRQVLLELSKVMAPFTPFMAERVYAAASGELESVHLDAWPVAQPVDREVIERMDRVREIVELSLAKRAETGIKIRQPLSELAVTGPKVTELQGELAQIIMDELNVKNVTFADNETLAVALNTELTPELQREGLLRELIRSVNDLRKKMGLTIQDRVVISWQSDSVVIQEMLADDTLLNELLDSTLADEYRQAETEGEVLKLNGEQITIAIVKK